MLKRIKQTLGLSKKPKVEKFKVFSDVDALPGYPKAFVWDEDSPKVVGAKRKAREEEESKLEAEDVEDDEEDEEEEEPKASFVADKENVSTRFSNNFEKTVNDIHFTKKARDERFESSRVVFREEGETSGSSSSSSSGSGGTGGEEAKRDDEDESQEERHVMRDYLFSKIRHGHIDVVQTCIDGKRHNVTTARDENGNTAIHVAVQNNHKKMVGILLKAGCSLNEMNKKNLTPLDYAELYKFTALADYLLLKGAVQGPGKRK